MSKQVTFNLDEESEIQFKLSIKGSTNLPNVKPMVRFIISETIDNGVAVVLPARSTDEGVTVSIPPLKEFFQENKDYIGKLEIIVGNRYFAPTAMNIGFTKSFDIQVESVIQESHSAPKKITKKHIQEADDFDDEIKESRSTAGIKKVINKDPITTNFDTEIPDDVLESLEREIEEDVLIKPQIAKKISKEKEVSIANKSKEIKQPINATKKPVKAAKKDPRDLLKDNLKNLLKEALK